MEAFIRRSTNVPYAFPTQLNRVAEIRDKKMLQEVDEYSRAVHPVIDKKTMELIDAFLAIKKSGSPAERSFYKDTGRSQLINRMLRCRPLVFMNSEDSFLLRSGERGRGGFEYIGTPEERPPLIHARYQTYDEMQLSALLCVSVPTHFINNGSRFNKSIPGKAGTFIPSGICLAQVGPRFEKPGFMEYAHLVVTETQNTTQNGYGLQGDPLLLAWAAFYGLSHLPTYDEFFTDTANLSIPIKSKTHSNTFAFLNPALYKMRIQSTARVALLEANRRAQESNAVAYCHIVGLGLGVWKLDNKQHDIYVDTFIETAKVLHLPYVGDIYFTYLEKHQSPAHITSQSGNSIQLHFGKRDPADLVPGCDANSRHGARNKEQIKAQENDYWLRNTRGTRTPILGTSIGSTHSLHRETLPLHVVRTSQSCRTQILTSSYRETV